MDVQQAVGQFVDSLVVGDSVVVDEITVVPLRLKSPGKRYSTLSDGAGDALVTEVGEGIVPEVLVRNQGRRPLLLLDGEELIGAKQNRVVNSTIVVKPGCERRVPVSCIEAGRWSARTAAFRSEGRFVPSSVNTSKRRRVANSLRTGRGYDADQGAVWADVATTMAFCGVASDTSALSEAIDVEYTRSRPTIDRVAPCEDEVGVAVFRGGALIGIEIVSHPRTWATVRAGVLASLWSGQPSPKKTRQGPQVLLHRLLARTASVHPGAEGEVDFRVTTGSSQLAAFVVDGEVVHVSASALA